MAAGSDDRPDARARPPPGPSPSIADRTLNGSTSGTNRAATSVRPAAHEQRQLGAGRARSAGPAGSGPGTADRPAVDRASRDRSLMPTDLPSSVGARRAPPGRSAGTPPPARPTARRARRSSTPARSAHTSSPVAARWSSLVRSRTTRPSLLVPAHAQSPSGGRSPTKYPAGSSKEMRDGWEAVTSAGVPVAAMRPSCRIASRSARSSASSR